MSAETTLTIVGNLTADPELRYTTAGAAVAKLTVASTARHYDRGSGIWRDDEPLFLHCTLWRQPAEHAAQSLSKGARVIVTGKLRQRSWDGANGERRTGIELDVDEIGASLRFATAALTKASGPAATEHAIDGQPSF